MKTKTTIIRHKIGNPPIKRDKLTPMVKKGQIKFLVSNVNMQDILNKDINGVNKMLLDDAVENGYMLMDVNYECHAVNKDKTITVEVTVNDVSEWLK